MLGMIILVTAIAGVGGTGLGGVIAALFRRDSSRLVSLLLAFAGGIMTGVVCFDMIESALNPEGSSEPVSVFFVMFGVMLGYVVIWLLNLWIDSKTNHEIEHIDENHPKTADDLDELIHSDHYARHELVSEDGGPASAYQLFIAGVVMACAIALHNMPEGMVIGASYASDTAAGIAGGMGVVMAVVIGLHNIPEGMAVGTLSPFWLSLSLSFASGAMLYVVFGELLPEAILMWRSKMPALASVIGILIGLMIIYI